MTNIKPRHILLILAVSVFAALSYGGLKLLMLFRPLGERGAVYETVETANNTFKVRMTARDEENVYMPGSYLIYESAAIDSDKWVEFLFFRADDAISIPQERFRFLNEQTAYVFLWGDFAVTLDGGRTWKIWKPFFPLSNGELTRWMIIEASIEVDGRGQAKVETYDPQLGARVALEIITEDFGQSWRVRP
jgi:hypothetical protein